MISLCCKHGTEEAEKQIWFCFAPPCSAKGNELVPVPAGSQRSGPQQSPNQTKGRIERIRKQVEWWCMYLVSRSSAHPSSDSVFPVPLPLLTDCAYEWCWPSEEAGCPQMLFIRLSVGKAIRTTMTEWLVANHSLSQHVPFNSYGRAFFSAEEWFIS